MVLGKVKLKALNAPPKNKSHGMGGAATAAGQSHTAMNRGEPCEKQAFTCHSVREGRTAVVMEGLGSTLYMTFKEES